MNGLLQMKRRGQGRWARHYCCLLYTSAVVDKLDEANYTASSWATLQEKVAQATTCLLYTSTADRAPMVGDTLEASFDVDEQYVDYARFRWLVADSKDGPFSPITDS